MPLPCMKGAEASHVVVMPSSPSAMAYLALMLPWYCESAVAHVLLPTANAPTICGKGAMAEYGDYAVKSVTVDGIKFCL